MMASSELENSTGAHAVIPLGTGWFFAPRYPDAIESDFRARYRRAFRGQMRAFWYLWTTAWALAAIIDYLAFPEHFGLLLAIRIVGLVGLVAAAAAVSLPKVVDVSLHTVTAVATAWAGLCAIAMFAAVPFPASWPYYLMLGGLCVVTTIFISTLSYETMAWSSLVVGAAFAVYVLVLAPIPFAYGAGLAALIVFVTCSSLSCTHLIERYARQNYAQRRALEAQSAAIAEKAHQLEISEGRARDANRAKSVFLSSMSHELRTPLNAVLGFAQFLERETGLSPEGHNNLRIIQRSGEHLLELINDVLAISKIEAGSVTLSEHTFDLHEMIRSVADMIRVRTEQKGLQLIVSVAPDVPRHVTGDDGKLRQVLINLLGNAVKFTDEGGLAMRAEWNGSAVVFELEDTGHGIADEEMGKLFEAFAQTESGRKSKEGTGLGLAISRNFVRQMGGDIRVRSELGRGTMFTVEAPLAVAERLAAETKPRRVTGLAPGEPRRRLLVVDDTTENRLLLTALLTTVGFEVREAANGREAIDVWAEWQPDLVWMDMRMPVMDGSDATREIRRREDTVPRAVATGSTVRGSAGPAPHPTKIIALTASAFEHERDAILESGCDDFVAKPFREETIFGKLAEHLGVRFVYEEADTAAEEAEEGEDVLTAVRLAALPVDRVRDLYNVLSNGDITAAASLATRIREDDDEQLGSALIVEIRAFRIDELLSLLEQLESTA